MLQKWVSLILTNSHWTPTDVLLPSQLRLQDLSLKMFSPDGIVSLPLGSLVPHLSKQIHHWGKGNRCILHVCMPWTVTRTQTEAERILLQHVFLLMGCLCILLRSEVFILFLWRWAGGKNENQQTPSLKLSLVAPETSSTKPQDKYPQFSFQMRVRVQADYHLKDSPGRPYQMIQWISESTHIS